MSSSKSTPPLLHLSAGAISGLVACTTLQPLDLLKTRLQQQRQQRLAILREAKLNGISAIAPANSTIYSNVKGIIQTGGIQGLWRGTIPTILRNVPGSALYFFTLSEIRTLLAKYQPIVQQPPSKSGSTLPVLSNQNNLIAGATARASVGFIMMPITVVKIRYESNFYGYKSIWDAFTSIVRQDGFKGLYAGFGATAMRDAPFAGIYVLFYEQCKRHANNLIIPRDSAITSAGINMMSGVIAGTAACVITQPFDMLKTRMQLKPNIYKNVAQSAAKVFQEEGFIGYFDGISVRLLRKSLNSAISWTIYEEITRAYRNRRLIDNIA